MNEKEITTKTREMLLGRLDDESRSRFEESFTADEQIFDIVRAAEDELVEQYAYNKLNDNDRIAFETNYLKLESGRRRLALTRSLIARSEFASPIMSDEKVSAFAAIAAFFTGSRAAIATGLAVVAMVVGGIWLVNRKPEEVAVQPTIPTPTPSVKTPEVTAPVPTPEIAELPSNKEPRPEVQPTPKQERASVPMVALIAGSLRDGGKMRQLSITEQTEKAIFRLKLDSNEYRAYHVDIVDADGRSVARIASVRAAGRRLDATVATNKLKTGEYIVKLSGLNSVGQPESVADYPVRIVRR